MTAPAERRTQPITMADKLPGEEGCASREQLVLQLERIRRIGSRLFGVAECVLLLRDGYGEFPPAGARQTPAQAFCASLPEPEGAMLVSDLPRDPVLCRHPAVAGASGIRFYADPAGAQPR